MVPSCSSVLPGGRRPEYRNALGAGVARVEYAPIVLGPPSALLLALAFGSACQGPVPPPAAPSSGAPSAAAPARSAGGAQAAYVIAVLNALLAIDKDGRLIGKLVELPPQTFASGATLHPEGRQIAFVLLNISQGTPSGFGSDIYEVNVDGSGLKKIVTHEKENTFYSGPAFDPSGAYLYFQRRSSFLRDGAPVNDDGIERLDLRSGERRQIVADGIDPTISPDGKTLVFIHLVQSQVDTMWIADANGANPRPFLKVKDRFFYIQTPRFAPTGCQVVFSGAGRTSVDPTSAGSHSAHLGIPSELYLSPCDGSSVTTVGETYDDVTPVWSPDGSKVGYALGGTVSIVTVATPDLKKLAQSDAFSFGDLVWLK